MTSPRHPAGGPPPRTPSAVLLVALPAEALAALLDRDLARASEVTGVALPPFFVEESWLWRIRLAQVVTRPDDAPWLVRAAVAADGTVVGHAGFHGAPDDDGTVEVGYTVVPGQRGRGWGHALLAALLARAAAEPGVRTVRASVRPDNVASLALLHHAGFVQVGEQLDEEDGLELVLERPAGGRGEPQAAGTPSVAPAPRSDQPPGRTSPRSDQPPGRTSPWSDQPPTQTR